MLAELEPWLSPDPFRGHRFVGPRFSPSVLQPCWVNGPLVVLADAHTVIEGERWLHVSFSRRLGIPTHADTTSVRRAFFRPDSVVAQVFPPVSEYVNVHPNCLHLWERLDGPRLIPDLRIHDPMLGGLGI